MFLLSDVLLSQVWDSVRMNNIAQHFATAWFGAKLSAIEEDRVRFQKFLSTRFSSRESAGEAEELWPGFESTEGKHPGLTLRKREAGTK